MATKKDNKKGGASLGIAAALVGAAAAGLYLYGPKGAQNRLKLKAWTLKAKAEVLEQFERAQEVSDVSYAEVVDKVTTKYGKLKSVGEEEAGKLNAELKRHWKAIKKVSTEPKKKTAKK